MNADAVTATTTDFSTERHKPCLWSLTGVQPGTIFNIFFSYREKRIFSHNILHIISRHNRAECIVKPKKHLHKPFIYLSS